MLTHASPPCRRRLRPCAIRRAAVSELSLLKKPPPWAVPHSEILLIERIGIGSFGDVYRAAWRGRQVAVKKLRVDSANSAPERALERALAFVAEMMLMAPLQHPNIVPFLAGCLEHGRISMVHELCAHSLHDVLHTPSVFHTSLLLPLALQLRWAREIALGVAYLHAQEPPIVHRDLKPGNILMSNQWVPMITDFGAARLRERSHIETARIGTCQWTAPEVLRQQPHDERADSYSFGVLLFELASRQPPYGDTAQQQVEVGVITGKQPRPNLAAAVAALEPRPPDSVLETLSALAEVGRRACRAVP